jgi:hypothetical protein
MNPLNTRPAPNSSLNRFSRYLCLSIATFVVLSIAFALYVFSEKQIDRANERRLVSFLLATELRQSSDELTRLARAYVITADPGYRQRYREVLDLRDGRKPRSAQELKALGIWSVAAESRSIPLLALLQETGLSRQEFALLQQAKQKSDALTKTELAAMDPGSAAAADDALRLQASRMLYDLDYLRAKNAIGDQINEFERLMDARTLDQVNLHIKLAVAMRGVFIMFGALLLFTLWRGYRSLQQTLGGSLDELHRRIVRIGSGDFNDAGEHAERPQGSMFAWLEQTRQSLFRLERARRDVEERNQRLSRMYSALGECNQAMLRAKDEAQLFSQICCDMVAYGGMQMVWIGMVSAETGLVRILASAGEGIEYQRGLVVSSDERMPEGRGPSGTAIREDRPYWCHDFKRDAATAPWRERAVRFGWETVAALPLHRGERVIGVMNVY